MYNYDLGYKVVGVTGDKHGMIFTWSFQRRLMEELALKVGL